jgi:hypothetical protein
VVRKNYHGIVRRPSQGDIHEVLRNKRGAWAQAEEELSQAIDQECQQGGSERHQGVDQALESRHRCGGPASRPASDTENMVRIDLMRATLGSSVASLAASEMKGKSQNLCHTTPSEYEDGRS